GRSKRRKPSSSPGEGDKEKPSDHIPCSTPLRTIGDNLVEIPAHDSANTTTRLHEEHHDEHSGVLGNRDGNFDDDVSDTRYREYDLAHLKLVFEFSIHTVWKSVRYGVSKGLDTTYWSFLEHGYAVSSLMDTAYW
ncbi:hypothetical protein Tco_0110154, partial [Tanacetum coccineum]